MRYVIRYKAQPGRMVDDAWLTSNFGGTYADEDKRRALKFNTQEYAKETLKRFLREGGDGREPGVIEECP